VPVLDYYNIFSARVAMKSTFTYFEIYCNNFSASVLINPKCTYEFITINLSQCCIIENENSEGT
jgi:hypothetical protein